MADVEEILRAVDANRAAVNRHKSRVTQVRKSSDGSPTTKSELDSMNCTYLCQQISLLPDENKIGSLQTPFGAVNVRKAFNCPTNLVITKKALVENQKHTKIS